MATEADLAKWAANAEKGRRENIRENIARAKVLARGNSDLGSTDERDWMLARLAYEAEQMLDWIEATEAKG